MEKIFIQGTNICSSLGFSTKENYDTIKKNRSGIKTQYSGDIYGDIPLSRIDKETFTSKIKSVLPSIIDYTFFEQLLIWSVFDALSNSAIDASSDKTIFVISTTKGNIEDLKNNKEEIPKTYKLWNSAQKVSKYFNNKNTPTVISNACVSGVMALNVSTQLLDVDMYDNAIVVGGDLVSDFVVSGFMSFLALSSNPCRPFDKERNGLTLGEASGCIVLSKKCNQSKFIIAGGSNTNDANHISGPSRTGEGMYLAIDNCLKESNIKPTEIDFISAHGTATNYNDEMEAIALTRHGLNNTLTNSFKGYWGHTLGASGVIEVIASVESMSDNVVIKSLGFSKQGTTDKLNIAVENEKKNLNVVLKTSAGFGGVNSAIIIRKL